MRTNTSLDFTGISSDLNEAIGDIGILYDEFLEEVEKLLKSGGYERVEKTQKALHTYSKYSKSVEKTLKGKSSNNELRDELLDSLTDFRQRKTIILDNILKKYWERTTPSMLSIRLGTSIFKHTWNIKVEGVQKYTATSILQMIKQKLLQIFKQK